MADETLHSAYVLHTRRYGDSSLIVELFVRERGRLACIAKGTLRSKRGSPASQLFQRLFVEIRGRGEVGSLTRAEPATTASSLAGQRLYCGLYVNELMQKLTAREDAHPILFDVYDETIAGLADDRPVEPLLRSFELRLLQQLGLGLMLEVDSQGQPIDAGRRYNYEPGVGAVPTDRDDSSAVDGQTLLAMQGKQSYDAQSLREARTLMRRVLDHHLDGRPLRSRELFQSAS